MNSTDPIIELLVDIAVPTASHPSEIVHIAQLVKAKSPDFDEAKFIERATTQWEDEHADELAAQQADYFAVIDGKEGADECN